MIEVGADVRVLRPLGQSEEAVHAVVELVVAGDGDLVARGVHQVDDGFALAERADRLALDGVAVVNEDHVVASGQQGIADLLQTGVAEALVDAAVNVAGEEDDGLAAGLDGSGLFGGSLGGLFGGSLGGLFGGLFGGSLGRLLGGSLGRLLGGGLNGRFCRSLLLRGGCGAAASHQQHGRGQKEREDFLFHGKNLSFSGCRYYNIEKKLSARAERAFFNRRAALRAIRRRRCGYRRPRRAPRARRRGSPRARRTRFGSSPRRARRSSGRPAPGRAPVRSPGGSRR